jgi:4-amino-4-deoxy-L-arabinose transferase-like glycosyltransferase
MLTPMKDRPSRWAIFGIALGVRLAAILWTGPSSAGFGDSLDYLATADHVCREYAYPDRGSLPFFRAPLLPAFIAATTLCHPEKVAYVKIGLALCDAATVVVIGEIAWLLFASSAVATLAALLAAINPFFVFGVVDIRTEPLFMLLLTAALWLLFRGIRGGTTAVLVLAGIAFGLAALTRPAGLAALAIAVATLVAGNRRWADRGVGVKVGGLVMGAVLALGPWTVRNAVRYHELIVVNDAAGFSFWRGSHPEMDRISRIADAAEYQRATTAFEEVVTPAAVRALAGAGPSPGAQSRAWFAAGIENVRRDPAAAAAFAARRAWAYWRPWLNPQEHGRIAVLGSAVLCVALYALAGVGVARFRRVDGFLFGWVVAYLLVVWIAHIPHQIVMRFRIPFTDPLLLVFAASATIHLSGRGASNPSS